MHAASFKTHDYAKALTSLEPDTRGIVEFTADFLNRPGGTIQQDNVVYTAHDKTFPDFNLAATYVLFLQPLPDSNSFLAFTGGCFEMAGSAVKTLSDPRNPSDLAQFAKTLSPSAFLDLILRYWQ